MFHRSEETLSQILGVQLCFSYPVPPYMSLRLRVRRGNTFCAPPWIHTDIPQRFERTDLVVKHPNGSSSSRYKHEDFLSQNKVPITRSPSLEQRGKSMAKAVRSYGGSHSKKEWFKFEEEDSPEFTQFNQYQAELTDTKHKGLFRQGLKVIAQPINSNKSGTMDIHTYSTTGHSSLQEGTSLSILQKLLDDPVSRSILQKMLGDSHSVSELDDFLNEPKPSQPVMESLSLESDDTDQSRTVIEALKSLKLSDKLAVALNFTGTNSYLACTGDPPSPILEELNANDLKNISGSGKRLIFLQDIENEKYSFESAMHPGFYICTSSSSSASPVMLRKDPERQKAISEFLLFPK